MIATDPSPVTAPNIDTLECELVELEAQIARRRSRQLEVLRGLEAERSVAMDGARNLTEWTAARLDVSTETATDLVRTARHAGEHPELASEVANGRISFDRAAATVALAAAGADHATVAGSRGLDLAGVQRLASRQRGLSRKDERRGQRDRFLVLQPSLDLTHWRLHGRLTGYDGAIVAEAVAERGDDLHRHDTEHRAARPQRAADALVTMARDALDGSSDGGDGERAPLVSVFVDAELAAETGGEAGAAMAHGPRIGPETLERLLCEGRVEVNTTGGRPLAVGHTRRAVPPRLRRFVLHRDGGCAIDGCESRYRLQAHHVVPFSEGGATDPDNLVTLCWFHHHVVVHGRGRRIDPASLPGRLRFLRHAPGRGPPR